MRGLFLCSAGACLVALGFTLLAQPCGAESLNPTALICAVPKAITETTYYIASLGSVLVVIGAWQAGVGRKKIVAEGVWLVIAVGAAISTIGFVISNILPWVSTASGEIGIIL